MLIPKAEPMLGNRNNARALSTNTTASETERFSDFAFTAEPTAGMAESEHDKQHLSKFFSRREASFHLNDVVYVAAQR